MRRPNKDDEHLGKLRDYYAWNHVIPPYSTIGKMTGMTAPAAFEMVQRLKKNNYLESTGRQLLPGPRFFESALLGTVQTGSPTPTMDNQTSGYDVMRQLLSNPSQSFLLQVKGESMVDAGLLEDDYVIVQRDLQSGIGDIVVARVDGDYTIKYFAEDANGPYLKPANKNDNRFREIRPAEDFQIFGVVTGSFRSYNPRNERRRNHIFSNTIL